MLSKLNQHLIQPHQSGPRPSSTPPAPSTLREITLFKVDECPSKPVIVASLDWESSSSRHLLSAGSFRRLLSFIQSPSIHMAACRPQCRSQPAFGRSQGPDAETFSLLIRSSPNFPGSSTLLEPKDSSAHWFQRREKMTTFSSDQILHSSTQM